MMKKALKIFGIVLLLFFGTALAIPLLFEDKIVGLVKDLLNRQLDAEVAYEDADLSLLRNFPNASLAMNGLTIVNQREAFANDTLAKAGSIDLALPLSALFNSEQVAIDHIEISNATVHIKIDSLGNANYDIAKKTTNNSAASETEDTGGLAFSLEDYSIDNSTILYEDVSAKTLLMLEEVGHSGKGDLSSSTGNLETHTDALVSFQLGNTKYLNRHRIQLDAMIGIDLENNRYAFQENEALVNQLPLIFDGFVQVNENHQEVDISFKTPSSDFKNFLAVIPSEYTKNLDGVATSGDFVVNGSIKGKVDDMHIPKLDIAIASNNASFKYPDLPKSVQDITLDVTLKNETGIAEETFLDVDKLQFRIDQDRFKASGKVTRIVENPTVNAKLDGRVDLSHLSQAYPIQLENKLQGTITTNMQTQFDMEAVGKERYERIKTSGNAQLHDLVYSSKDVMNPISIHEATINFTPSQVTLEKFNATTGKSDLEASGTLSNFMGFLLSNKKLQGNINVDADTFAVSDFMEESDQAYDGNDSGEGNTSEPLKIPDFLDCTIHASAKAVLYDDLTLRNVKGTLRLKDQKAILSNVTSSIFGGNLALNGEVNTQDGTPTFNIDLGIDSFDIAQSFQGMELLQSLAPIANILQGKLNTTLKLSGELQQDYSLDLSSVAGNALAEVLATRMNADNATVLRSLGSGLSFLDLEKLNLDKLKTRLDFKDGKVAVKPFDIRYEDIAIEVGGTHGFNKTIDYNVTFQVPAKYLGKEAEGLVAQLSDEEQATIIVPVTANLTGTYTSPSVKTDLQAAIKNLSQQIIEYQKQKAIDKGKDRLNDLIGDVLGGKEKDPTSTKNSETDVVKDAAENILGNLFGKKKKAKDSIQKN